MTALVHTASGLAVPTGADESIPEWKIVAASFLSSYRNATHTLTAFVEGAI